MASIELFLCSAEGGQTLREGLEERALAHTGASVGDARPTVSPVWGADPNSLADQGWGVIAPRGPEGDRLLELVRPLIERRSEDCGREVRVYRVPPALDAAQSVAWVDRVFRSNELQEDVPWYMLVLGQPEQVSLELQQVLSNSSLVGRLAFDDDGHYEAYAAKILGWERQQQGAELARALFFTAMDGTGATALGHESLMLPTIADAHERMSKSAFPVSEILPIEGAASDAGNRLLAAAAAGGPSILLSCSHGLGPPRSGWPSLDHQLALQGALSLGGGEQISGESVAGRPFLPGGMWFFFACFSAGTPARSAYHHWLARLARLGEFGPDLDAVLAALPGSGDPPFIASLPKAALANPRGPLAVIGHLDLAWSYGFQDIEKFRDKARHRRFQGPLREMARGSRAGLALHSLLEHRAAVQTELTVAADAAAEAEERAGEPMDDEARLGHRWMLHQDLDGYILLGDPAARLSIESHGARRGREQRARSNAPASIVSAPPLAASSTAQAGDTSAGSVSAAVEVGGLRIAAVVEIVRAAIAIEESLAALAARYRVDMTGATAAALEALAAKHGVSTADLSDWVARVRRTNA
ncbi:MAG TPA: hypothetical protein VNM90_18225 [Haliangium sp.]|nr:hypothetical protein [Haliangium sp.]